MDIIGIMSKLIERLNKWNFDCEVTEILSRPKENTHIIHFDYKDHKYMAAFVELQPFRLVIDITNLETQKTDRIYSSINCNEHDLYFLAQALTKTAR